MGHLVLNNVHDVTYNNVTFDGAGGGNPDVSGVIEISGNSYNINFVNCTIDPNRDGQGNGVKIVDGGRVHDVTFQNCHFLTQPLELSAPVQERFGAAHGHDPRGGGDGAAE